jgi:hypothetical protein
MLNLLRMEKQMGKNPRVFVLLEQQSRDETAGIQHTPIAVISSPPDNQQLSRVS